MSPSVGRFAYPKAVRRLRRAPPGLSTSCASAPGLARACTRLALDRRANAAAEFALLLPVFLTMMAAVIQYGSMLMTYNSMMVSARDAAREVAVGRQTHGNASNRAKGKRPGWVAERDYAVNTRDTGATDVQSTVTVPGEAATVLPVLPSPAALSVTVTMAKES